MTKTSMGIGTTESGSVNLEQKLIEALAYQLWLARGCPVGDDQEDWFRAEEQLRDSVTREKRWRHEVDEAKFTWH